MRRGKARFLFKRPIERDEIGKPDGRSDFGNIRLRVNQQIERLRKAVFRDIIFNRRTAQLFKGRGQIRTA